MKILHFERGTTETYQRMLSQRHGSTDRYREPGGCFWCEVVSGELKLLEAEAARWLMKEELDSVQWLPADVTLIDKIRKCME